MTNIKDKKASLVRSSDQAGLSGDVPAKRAKRETPSLASDSGQKKPKDFFDLTGLPNELVARVVEGVTGGSRLALRGVSTALQQATHKAHPSIQRALAEKSMAAYLKGLEGGASMRSWVGRGTSLHVRGQGDELATFSRAIALLRHTHALADLALEAHQINLDASRNHLGIPLASQFGRVLATQRSLTTLSLVGQSFRSVRVCARLAPYLALCQSLTTLKLDENAMLGMLPLFCDLQNIHHVEISGMFQGRAGEELAQLLLDQMRQMGQLQTLKMGPVDHPAVAWALLNNADICRVLSSVELHGADPNVPVGFAPAELPDLPVNALKTLVIKPSQPIDETQLPAWPCKIVKAAPGLTHFTLNAGAGLPQRAADLLDAVTRHCKGLEAFDGMFWELSAVAVRSLAGLCASGAPLKDLQLRWAGSGPHEDLDFVPLVASLASLKTLESLRLSCRQLPSIDGWGAIAGSVAAGEQHADAVASFSRLKNFELSYYLELEVQDLPWGEGLASLLHALQAAESVTIRHPVLDRMPDTVVWPELRTLAVTMPQSMQRLADFLQRHPGVETLVLGKEYDLPEEELAVAHGPKMALKVVRLGVDGMKGGRVLAELTQACTFPNLEHLQCPVDDIRGVHFPKEVFRQLMQQAPLLRTISVAYQINSDTVDRSPYEAAALASVEENLQPLLDEINKHRGSPISAQVHLEDPPGGGGDASAYPRLYRPLD